MSRTQRKQASAILAADLHLRMDQPACRTDDYRSAQTNKLKWLSSIQKKYGDPIYNNTPILVAGDVFHTWKPLTTSEGFEMVTYAMGTVPPHIIAITGQHDLPYHSLDNFYKSPLSALSLLPQTTVCSTVMAHTVQNYNFIVCAFPWGTDITKDYSSLYKITPLNKKAALIHKLIMNPEAEENSKIKYEGTPDQILDQLKDFDLVVSGDNHIPFTYRNKRGQLLVNPGSMMRMRADQIDHKPRVYLWYAETNEVEPVYFPIQEGVVVRDHIREEPKEGTQGFIRCLNNKNSVELSLSFEDNIKEHIQKNNVNKRVTSKIYKAMEEDHEYRR